MTCNSVCLSGKLSSFDALRYSPAGIAIMEFRLIHASPQIEGGMRREIEFEIDGMAVAETAIRLSGLQKGNHVRAEGFLARRGPKNRKIVFHINHFELIG